MYFVSHKYVAANDFEKFLAYLRVEGAQPEVVLARSNDGGDSMKRKFGKLCRERKKNKNSQLQTARSTTE